MAHIVLLGDSIFDNAPYVPAGMEVQAQLRVRLGPAHRVSLLACDGDVMADMVKQVTRLEDLPEPADWLVVSCGGNDVLGLVAAMQSKVGTVLDAAELLASWQRSRRSTTSSCAKPPSETCPCSTCGRYARTHGTTPLRRRSNLLPRAGARSPP